MEKITCLGRKRICGGETFHIYKDKDGKIIFICLSCGKKTRDGIDITNNDLR